MMTEAEWQAAERRDPTKTYIEPELTPLFRDWRLWAFILMALIPLCGLASIWPDEPRGTLPETYFLEMTR